jgi:outer membrane protein assembly factor BamA
VTVLRSWLAGLALLPVAAAGAQETRCERGDVEVRSLSFTGNEAFTDAELAAGIVTTPSSWARRALRVIGTRRCLDRRAFPDDVLRLTLWYRNHGFVNAVVDTIVTSVGRERVAVRFVIFEGAPLVVDTLRIHGIDAVPERAEVLARLPTTVGGRFDRYANRATRDSITSRLRDNGYPEAETYLGYETRLDEGRATVEFSVEPGPRRRIGRVAVTRAGRDGRPPEVGEAAVRRLAGIREGELYRERLLERAKRTLYQSEAFAQVLVAPGAVAEDSSVTVDVDVTEGYLRTARLGGGWGTLDCFRTTGEFTEYNLFRSATRLEMRGRVSKIGIGEPLDGARGLCQVAGKDLYGGNLNYYVGATVSQPSLLRASFVPTLSLYSERRSEFNAYLRTTPAGASVAMSRSLPRRTHAFSYSMEYGRTEAQPALFCAVFNACEAEDRLALQRTQRLAVLAASTGYERTDRPLDPTTGVVGRVEARHASRFIGADAALQFTRLTGDGTLYVPLGRDAVLATRFRIGAVLGPTFALGDAARFVPAQERLFAGGPTTVRGFRQNELGPAVYIPTAFDTVNAAGARVTGPVAAGDTVYFRANVDSVGQRAVPTGGNTLLVGNAELRFSAFLLPSILRWTLFTDVGQVWNRGEGLAGLRSSAMRWTPGFGVRIRTPIGFLRADLAYNPYRRTAGAAFFDAPIAAGGALFCVSPGNTLPVTRQDGQTGARLVQMEGACPATYRPPTGSSFFSRLTPSIAIGQAF